MSSSTKVTLTFTNEALEALNKMATERKRGDFVSKLVLQTLKSGGKTDEGILERIDNRLARIEQQVITVDAGCKKQ